MLTQNVQLVFCPALMCFSSVQLMVTMESSLLHDVETSDSNKMDFSPTKCLFGTK